MLKKILFFVVAMIILGFEGVMGEDIAIIDKPNTESKNNFYISNGELLSPSFFIKFPAGTVKPQGWVRRQLELQADGLCGRLYEISNWLKSHGPKSEKKNAWLSPTGDGDPGYDEIPYWIRAFSRTGYVSDNSRINKMSREWIQTMLRCRRDDGYFGPTRFLTGFRNRVDFYPSQMVLNTLEGYYEYTGDKAVLDLLLKFYYWMLMLPDKDFMGPATVKNGYHFHDDRSVENISSIYWLYNRTGETWLLDLATKVFCHSNPWYLGLPSLHGVNMAQSFRLAGVYHQQMYNDFKGMGFEKNVYLDATEHVYQLIKQQWGQVPGGLFGADEGAVSYRFDPRQGVETCAIVEFMKSCEELLLISGDIKWADRCEDAVFNTLPAALTADHKALHYITAPNLILCDRAPKNSCFGNEGPLLVYDPNEAAYRCCLHNYGIGWAYYSEHLWLASPDNGLAVVFYAPSKVTAKVGKEGDNVMIEQVTRYPFEDIVEISIALDKPVEFPLYLRVPGWCDRATVWLNGSKLDLNSRPYSYFKIDRQWKNSDKVKIHLNMPITITQWKKNKDCVSVNRGPLTYSLKIGEKYVRDGGTSEWPAWEVRPTTPWNYGLVLDNREPATQFEVVKKSWPEDNQPFKFDASPIEFKAKACRIPEWKADQMGAVESVLQSPVKVSTPIEEVTLIPMGCARLRISAFPTIFTGGN